jgi:hypothetical protein
VEAGKPIQATARNINNTRPILVHRISIAPIELVRRRAESPYCPSNKGPAGNSSFLDAPAGPKVPREFRETDADFDAAITNFAPGAVIAQAK